MTRMLRIGVVGATLLIAGCGGGSSHSSTSTTAKAPSSPFATQANAICAAAGAKIDALPIPASAGTAQAAAIIAQLPIESAELAQLRQLTPPAAQAANFRTALDNLAQIKALVPQVAAADRDDNTNALQVLGAQVGPLSTRATAIAQILGLTKCAIDYSPSGTASG